MGGRKSKPKMAKPIVASLKLNEVLQLLIQENASLKHGFLGLINTCRILLDLQPLDSSVRVEVIALALADLPMLLRRALKRREYGQAPLVCTCGDEDNDIANSEHAKRLMSQRSKPKRYVV